MRAEPHIIKFRFTYRIIHTPVDVLLSRYLALIWCPKCTVGLEHTENQERTFPMFLDTCFIFPSVSHMAALSDGQETDGWTI